MALFSVSGGLTYHYLAWRYKNNLWLDFQRGLKSCLSEWKSREHNLVLIGPSGGYNLPNEFLNRFDKLIAFDPDPLAPFLFKKTHPNIKNIIWSKTDVLGLSQLDPSQLNDNLSVYKGYAVLFCNVIGQLPLLLLKNNLHSVDKIDSYMSDLAKEMQKLAQTRSVASFHDLYSSDLHNPKVLRDHLTVNLFKPTQSKTTLRWLLSPREEHQIGFVSLI